MAKKKSSNIRQNQVKNQSSDESPKDSVLSDEKIVIDAGQGLVFSSEDELYEHFSGEIQQLEEFFFSHRSDEDIALDQFMEFEECLPLLLEEPFEIWLDDVNFKDLTVMNYIGEFEDEEDLSADPIFYVAQVYLVQDVPSFVYLHFPTTDEKLVELYRRGQLVFDQSRMGILAGALEGDALSEGEELSVGLYKAMLKLRSEKDIAEEDFREFADLREETIEEADEIWQSTDLQGNVLVSFVKEFPDVEVENLSGEDLYYIAVTTEDSSSQTHALLFSFPTVDRHLVDRYRHGENLQAEEVVQQSNH